MGWDLNWILCSAWKKWIGGIPSEHPLYSPHFIPCNFWAFLTMKTELWGKKFLSDQSSAMVFMRLLQKLHAHCHACPSMLICKMLWHPPCRNFVIPEVLVDIGICKSRADVQFIGCINNNYLSTLLNKNIISLNTVHCSWCGWPKQSPVTIFLPTHLDQECTSFTERNSYPITSLDLAQNVVCIMSARAQPNKLPGFYMNTALTF
jgi:hypothetical protein